MIGDVKGKVAAMVDDMIDTAGEIYHSDVSEINKESDAIC